jgi:hypothetical protein
VVSVAPATIASVGVSAAVVSVGAAAAVVFVGAAAAVVSVGAAAAVVFVGAAGTEVAVGASAPQAARLMAEESRSTTAIGRYTLIPPNFLTNFLHSILEQKDNCSLIAGQSLT